MILCIAETLKLALKVETKAWCQAYGKACNAKYKAEMDQTFEFIEEMNKKLSHTISDLDDIRHIMSALKTIREREIKIDMGIGPIEVCYGHQDIICRCWANRCLTLKIYEQSTWKIRVTKKYMATTSNIYSKMSNMKYNHSFSVRNLLSLV